MSARIQAPPARLVDALSGAKAPDKFMAALSEADEFVREVDGLRELQCRVDELTAENAELERRRYVSECLATVASASRDQYGAMVDQLIIERNALAEERDELDQRCNGLADYISDVEDQRDTAIGHLATVKAENTDLAERLDSLSNAHRITLAALADAKRELANLRREGDVFIGKAAGAL